MNEIMEIGPREEARRLWQGARAAFDEAGEHLARLGEALDLGIRAIEILVWLRLQPIRDRFPGSIAMLLDSRDPEVDPKRDSISIPKSLTFLDMIDILSDDGLECVSRGLHHGWEDRDCACRRARGLAREALRLSLDEDRRERLLVLEAYRNRIFRTPPPVRIVPGEITAAFPSLVWVYQRLSEPVSVAA